MRKLKFLIAIWIFILGCKTENMYTLNELNTKSLNPEFNNYGVLIKIKGENKCPIDFSIYSDGNVFQTYKLGERIDTLIRNDWYQSVLTFKSSPTECINDKILVKVSLLN